MAGNYKLSDSCQIEGLGAIYQRVFGIKGDGLFIEIGAFDGETWSNTSGLADMGWKGYYVEPLVELCQYCARRHKHNNVTVLNAAIGNREGFQDLYLSGQLTTADPIYRKIYEQTVWSKGRVSDETRSVRVTTLDALLTELELPQQIDVLVIDVEGHEYEVLQGFSIGQWTPTMVIIEVEDEHQDFVNRHDALSEEQVRELSQRFKAIRDYFRQAGYEIKYKDTINTVYVRGQ